MYKRQIHNTLEAAAWSKPVIIGPNYHKFAEARALIAEGGAFSIESATQMSEIANRLLADGNILRKCGAAGGNFVQQNKGASEQIVRYIQENRLLTIA